MSESSAKATNMFSGLKTPRGITGYTLMRGTTDWSNLKQFDMYEKGFPYLVVVSIPEFLQKMTTDPVIKDLLQTYVHTLEYEFRGLTSGLDNLGTDTQEITNNIQSMPVITKTTGITGGTFSMNFFEKSGTPIIKTHELFLRSVRDPGTNLKHYNGLIGTGSDATYQPSEAGFDKECFTFLYMHTDNTGLMIERAILYVGCQPTSAELSQYIAEKGNPEFVEVSTEFTGFPIMGSAVNAKAKELLDWINSSANQNHVQRNSWDFNYNAIDSTSGLSNPALKTAGGIMP